MAVIEQDSKINRIRQLMMDGEERTADTVAEATGLDRKEVSVALSAETRAQRLTRVSPGTYRWAREGDTAPTRRGKARKASRRGSARRAQRTEQVTEVPEDTIVFRVLATLDDGSLVCLRYAGEDRENGQLCKAYVSDLAELGR